MVSKRTLYASITICAVLLVLAVAVPILGQALQYNLEPGEKLEFEVVCATCYCPTITATATDTPDPTETPRPTVVPSTPTPTDAPTSTPEPTVTNTPEPTATPEPSAVWHGIVRSPQDAWGTIAAELGGSVVEHLVRPSASTAEIVAALDAAEALGLRVLVHPYDSSQNTNAPWYLDGDDWHITAWGENLLRAVEDHPTLFAVYALHEPFDSGGYHADTDAQRDLYELLKSVADVPVYTDISSLAGFADVGLSDGMCDYCATFPCTWRGEWTSEESLAETLRRMDADYATQQALMPDSKLVFLINTYTLGDGTRYRMPTAAELDAARDHACGLGVPVLYYPWSGYDASLAGAPELWPVIAEGCGTVPPPPTQTPAPSTPTGTVPPSTPTPQPGELVVGMEVTNYDPESLVGLGPFSVYGFVVTAQMDQFDARLADLVALAGDPQVVERMLMFSTYADFASKVDEIPAGIGVFYNSEPSLSADYNDIFIDGPNNSVVKFAALAEARGLTSGWGPLLRNLDTHVADGIPDAILAQMFGAGLDRVGMQWQQFVDEGCVDELVHGPMHVGTNEIDAAAVMAARLRAVAGRDVTVSAQIMPGYEHIEGCWPGDAYAAANCGTDIGYTYQHCDEFVSELTGTGLVGSIGIWASVSVERAQLPVLVRALREHGGGPTPTATHTPEPTNTPVPSTPTPEPPTVTPEPTATSEPGGAIVIDHTSYAADLSQAQLDAARQTVSFFNHKSIGNNILDGIDDLAAQDPTRYSIAVQYSSGTAVGINHYQAGSNQYPYDKIDGFAARVSNGHDVAFMKFCVGDFEPWTGYDAGDIADAYLTMMTAQQAEHPGTAMVYWTSPLTTESDGRGLASFEEFNARVRAHVDEYGGVLFDIADVESNGGTCTRDGVEAMCDGYSTDGAHLNEVGRRRGAGALWVLLAEVGE